MKKLAFILSIVTVFVWVVITLTEISDCILVEQYNFNHRNNDW